MKRKSILLTILLVSSMFALSIQLAPTAQAQSGVELKVLVSGQQKPIIELRVDELVSADNGISSVSVVASGDRADDQLQYLNTILGQGSDEFDVIGMDVIWTAGFADNGWLTDLTSDYPQSERDKYLDAHVDAMMYDDKVYAAPFFFDSGLLLYRKDILQRNGFATDASDFSTWSDFKTNLNAILDNSSEIELNDDLEGYVAQSDAYEGGVVNLVEWMGGSDGTFLDENGDPNFESAEPALKFWKSLIAPRYTTALNNTGTDAVMERSELVGDEGSAVNKWLAGNAVFQRNWPFSYLLSLDNEFLNGSDSTSDWPADEARFGVTTLPYNSTVCDASCPTQALGGAVLGIPEFSQNKDEAKALLAEIGSADAQLEMFTEVGNLPALESVYTSGNIPDELSYAEEFYNNVFGNVLSRPIHPDYADMSNVIQPLFHDAISGARSIDSAIQLMNEDVDLIIAEAEQDASVPEEVPLPGFSTLLLVLGTIAVANVLRRKIID